ncbi:TlpA disulfide reductase family protein [Roseovarius rhodophyticola]|uniref:TlpA disulfide reductase family protein n=1 Tax=Roseovarius rhodophyticola TaxID=3080827 RepID=A0ABZ2TIR1_9RHOB|nr:TlpA disulfide reductase family protein [Roseovarius sp. W115]MDV2929845.1 TlpA disulfide reductase family protein [Roseovarius sp. W115]
MKVKSLVLYMALAFGANAALADSAQIAELREGDMKKLVVHSEPLNVSDTPFNAEDGGQMSLKDFKGKVTAVNFWAVWCAPCRHEMPMLSDLQTELGGDDFEVVTIAMGRNAPQAMVQFFGEIGVENLPLHADPRMGLSREMGVFGLPVTILLDRNGQEVARLQGDAQWNSDSAKNIIRAMMKAGT